MDASQPAPAPPSENPKQLRVQPSEQLQGQAFINRRRTVPKTTRVTEHSALHNMADNLKYQNLMNFESQVLKGEFEKAERMLKKTDQLIEKYKDKGNVKSVKFALPEV